MQLDAWLQKRPSRTRATSALKFDVSGNMQRRSTLHVVGVTLERPLLGTKHRDLLFANPLWARDVGLDTADFKRFLELCEVCMGAGAAIEATPFAWCYSGFQFGVLAGQLGDGRCATIVQAGCGWPSCPWVDIQLKGGGFRTPYARGLDGMLTSTAAVKEFLIQEVLHKLGIDTARSIAVSITPTDRAYRETDGNTVLHGTAVLLRSMTAGIRIGTLEALFFTGAHELLKQLLEHFAATYVPHLARQRDVGATALQLLRYSARRIGIMVAKWTAHGFVHGVMNTDNITLQGETIDLGPCAFLDHGVDDGFTKNSDDERKMYAFGRQREAGLVAVKRLANALSPFLLGPLIAQASDAVTCYQESYELCFRCVLAEKLGLPPTLDDADVAKLTDAAWSLLRSVEMLYLRGALSADEVQEWSFTRFFIRLPTLIPNEVQVEFAQFSDALWSALHRHSHHRLPLYKNPTISLTNEVIQSLVAYIVSPSNSHQERSSRMATVFDWIVTKLYETDESRDAAIASIVAHTPQDIRGNCGCG